MSDFRPLWGPPPRSTPLMDKIRYVVFDSLPNSQTLYFQKGFGRKPHPTQ